MMLQRMETVGVILNEKSVFSVSKIKLIENIISKEGVQVDSEKIKAIVNFARPQNVSKLRRLPDMANHVGKFPKSLVETTKLLRALL